MTAVFQSTPAHQDGRNGQIHCNSGSNCVFQSTPAHQDGRNFCFSVPFSMASFQSTPAHQDGRNVASPARLGQGWQFQSTPAHQDGRNARFIATPGQIVCFNPLPPTRTGETVSLFGSFQWACRVQFARNPFPKSSFSRGDVLLAVMLRVLKGLPSLREPARFSSSRQVRVYKIRGSLKSTYLSRPCASTNFSRGWRRR